MFLRFKYFWPIVKIIFAICLITTLVIYRPTNLTVENAFLAIAITILGLIPAFIYVRQPTTQRSPVPLMALTGVYYAVFFGASAFLVVFLSPPYIKLIAYCPEIACVHSPTNEGLYWINWRTGINYHNIWIRNILSEAQLLIFGGISAMFITWAWTRKILPIGQIRVSSRNYSRGQYRLLLWILAATNILYLYSPLLSSLPSIGQLFVPVSYLVFAGFLALLLRT